MQSSGSGLGLFNSSASSLGGDNAGNAQVGRGRDRFYVSTATGNLVVQSVDDTLAAIGLDYAQYAHNSQGFTDRQRRPVASRRAHAPLGRHGRTGVNTSGSRLTKTFGDPRSRHLQRRTVALRVHRRRRRRRFPELEWFGVDLDGRSRSTEEYALVAGVQRIKFSRDTDSTRSLITTRARCSPASTWRIRAPSPTTRRPSLSRTTPRTHHEPAVDRRHLLERDGARDANADE